AFALGEGRSVSFRHVIGALPQEAGGEPPRDIATAQVRMRLTAADGSARDVAFDSDFLRIGQPLPA
ncbi:hypothetical protein EOD08_36135, partial [Mesorhizobium sp. M6A.T.Ca.TU.002.02.2.1]